jgi:hypothetical protein
MPSTTMKLLRAAEQLNRQGVCLLAAGEPVAALQTFRSAAVAIRDVSRAPVDSFFSSESQHAPKAYRSSADTRKIPSLEYEGFYIFNQCLLFEAMDLDIPYASVTEDDIRYLVAITLCNMALCVHTQARKLGQDVYRQRALSLYSMSMEMLRYTIEFSDDVQLLIAVALNNSSQIHFELGDVREAGNLLDVLEPLTATMSEHVEKVFPVDEYNMNILVTDLIKTAPSA